MRERFRAQNPRSGLLPLSTPKPPAAPYRSAALQQRVRTAFEGLAPAGGPQSRTRKRRANEVLRKTPPTPQEAVPRSPCTRSRLIGELEHGRAPHPPPPGGSYFIEAFTTRMEEDALKYLPENRPIGWDRPGHRTRLSAAGNRQCPYAYQKQLERGEKIILGVNKYAMEEKKRIEYLRLDEGWSGKQIARLHRSEENPQPRTGVRTCLADLRRARRGAPT